MIVRNCLLLRVFWAGVEVGLVVGVGVGGYSTSKVSCVGLGTDTLGGGAVGCTLGDVVGVVLGSRWDRRGCGSSSSSSSLSLSLSSATNSGSVSSVGTLGDGAAARRIF